MARRMLQLQTAAAAAIEAARATLLGARGMANRPRQPPQGPLAQEPAAWSGASPAATPATSRSPRSRCWSPPAATSGVPYAFKLIIDKGFAPARAPRATSRRWFEYLLMLVGVMALATAVRFYFVSWLGERTVADIRLAVHRNLLRLSPGFFEENRPAEITSRHHRRHDDHRAGRRHHRFGRAAQHRHGHRLHRSSCSRWRPSSPA